MATKASVFADLQGLPTSLGEGVIYDSMKPVSTGVDLPASQTDRAFKSQWDDERMDIDTDGFTIYLSMGFSEEFDPLLAITDGVQKQRTPNVFIKLTIGQTPTYSFYFGDDAPSYNFMPTSVVVERITINKRLNSTEIFLSDGKMSVNKGVFSFSWANEQGTQGYAINKVKGYNTCFMSVAPYSAEAVKLFTTALKKQELEGDTSALGNAIKELNGKGEGLYMWNADNASIHLSPQSFTFDESLSKKFLLPPKVDFKGKKALNTQDSYIRFNCVMENAALRTDNYTGYDPADPSIHLTTIQFPGDEALLAPMGTSKEGTEVACGSDSAEGRVLKAIIPAMNVAETAVQEVKLEFYDGSECIFPNAESGLFTAKDKETGQELQGRVENLIIAEGSWKEAYATETVNRIERNVKSTYNLMEGDKNITSAIAWETANNEIKVIIPTKKGSKLITIALTGA